MKKIINNFISSKAIISVAILSLIVIFSIAGTYAWFTWVSPESTSLTMTIGKLADITFSSGNNISAKLVPVFNYHDGEKTVFSIDNRDTSGASIRYIVKLNVDTIPSEFRNDSVKYTLVKNENVVVTGNLSDATDDCTIEIYSDTLFSGVVDYKFYLYIDGNVENNSSMVGKTITGNIIVDVFEFTGDTLVELISKKYNTATKTEVTNNNIKYNYATSVSLMNDRLGGTTADYDSGNIRFYGANPNNYIDIGDTYIEETGNWDVLNLGISSQSQCYMAAECSNLISMGWFDNDDECNAGLPSLLQQFGYTSVDDLCTIIKKEEKKTLYRIIGIFKDVKLSDGTTKDLVKIIRNDSIGTFAWGSSNNWTTSTLKQILNDTYYNSGSTIHNYLNGITQITETSDLSQKGLDNLVKSKLESVVWNLGMIEEGIILSSNYMYQRERLNNNNNSTWTGKVALAYPSDYAYASNEQCNDYRNSSDTCSSNDWIYKYNDTHEWLLTAYYNNEINYASVIYKNAGIAQNEPDYGNNVRPVFYLNSGVSVISGDGSETNPYVVR